MMLMGTIRAARSELRNVDLSNLVEPLAPMSCEHIGQAGHHPSPDDEPATIDPSPVIEVEDVSNIGDAVAYRHDCFGTSQKLLGDLSVTTCSRCDDDRVDISDIGGRFKNPWAEVACCSGGNSGSIVDERNNAVRRGADNLAGGASSRGSGTHHNDASLRWDSSQRHEGATTR